MQFFFKVQYVITDFDLGNSESASEFIFQLYNFVSVAKAYNDDFHNLAQLLATVKQSVARNQYQTFTSFTSKRKRETPKVPLIAPLLE